MYIAYMVYGVYRRRINRSEQRLESNEVMRRPTTLYFEREKKQNSKAQCV